MTERWNIAYCGLQQQQGDLQDPPGGGGPTSDPEHPDDPEGEEENPQPK